MAKLIGDAEITAIFDPYLDNKGLATIIDLVSLSGRVSPQFGLFTSLPLSIRLAEQVITTSFRS